MKQASDALAAPIGGPPAPTVTARPVWADLIDLAGERLGGRALAASDEFFAEKDNLLRPEKPIFIPGKFTERGKWMDGWESRRKRTPGHDWCIIALGRPGSIRGVNVDTSYFNGNQPEHCTMDAAEIIPTDPPAEPESLAMLQGARWTEIIPRTPLQPSSEHYISSKMDAAGRRFTHVRLNIFPDGGVARLRVHGEVLADWKALAAGSMPIDFAAAENGGLVVACNDMHFGSRHNLILPGRAVNMGDGWETRRKRGLVGGEHDWVIVRLAHRAFIQKIEVDTSHFKGNYPDSCEVEAADAPRGTLDFEHAPLEWWRALRQTKLTADTRHFFDRQLEGAVHRFPVNVVRLKIFPDGGVGRLRVWGRPAL